VYSVAWGSKVSVRDLKASVTLSKRSAFLWELTLRKLPMFRDNIGPILKGKQSKKNAGDTRYAYFT
jgi:hypothetical protein